MGEHAFVEAIVVSHDSAEALPDCLAALRASRIPVTVVDNASQDASAEVARRSGATIIRNAQNEGYGRANTIGARASDATHLLVVNPDVVVTGDAVARLAEASARYPEAGLLAPRIVEPDGRIVVQPRSLLSPPAMNRAGRVEQPDGDCCTPFLSGACFLIRRSLFLDIGGFDPAIFLFYEDDDLCRRLSDRGRPPVHVHGAVAHHARGGSSARRPGRVFNARWHLAWSRAYVARKYGLPDGAMAAFARNAPKAAAACLVGRGPIWERYAGSAAGSLAFLRGRTALAREGLAPWPR